MSRNVEIFPNMRDTFLNLRDINNFVAYGVYFLSWKSEQLWYEIRQ
jgi:hypothetical protein